MGTPYALDLKLDLKTFRTNIGEVKRRLSAIANAPIQKLADGFRPVVQGARNMATAIRGAQLHLLAMTGAATAGLFRLSRAGADSEESMSKFRAVFKGLSGDANEFVRDLAANVGRSEQELVNFMATLQDTFVPLGFAREEAFELSKQVTRLTLDLASFNNKADADVLLDLQSALVGNTETVRKYGVAILESTLKQKAFTEGLDPKNLSEQQKAFLRLKLILEGTTDAQGDAVRTAGSFANTVKGLTGSLKDLAGMIGQQVNAVLLEHVQRTREIVASIREWVQENPRLVASLSLVTTALGGALVSFGVMAPFLVSVIGLLGSLASGVGSVAGSFFSIPGIIAAVVVGLGAFIGGSGLGGAVAGVKRFITESGKAKDVLLGLRTAFLTAFEGLKEVAASVIEPIRAFIDRVGGEVFGILNRNAEGLGTTFAGVGDKINSVLTRAADAIRNVLARALNFLRPVAVTAVETIIGLFQKLPGVLDVAGDALTKLANFAANVFAILIGDTEDVGKTFYGLRDVVISAMRSIEGALTSETAVQALAAMRVAVALLAAGFGVLWTAGQVTISNLLELFSQFATVVGYVTKALGYLSDTMDEISDEVLAIAEDAMSEAERLTASAQQKIAAISRQTISEVQAAAREFNDPGLVTRRLKAERAARNEELKHIAQVRKEELEKAKQWDEALKAEVEGRLKLKELNEEQNAALLTQTQAAWSTLSADLARRDTIEEIVRVLPEYEREVYRIAELIEKQTAENKKAVSVEKQKTEAAKATARTQKEQEDIAKRLKKAQQEVNTEVEKLLEARVKATKTIKDDLALLARQRDAQISNAKSAEEASRIRLAYLLRMQRVIEENARKEREAAKDALEDIRERAKTFEEFITSIDRAYRKRKGQDIEVAIEEIGETFREQLTNLTDPADIKKFKDALAKSLEEPLKSAAQEARRAREELAHLLAERERALSSRDTTGNELATLQNQINKARDEVVRAQERQRAIAQQSAKLQADFASELKGLRDQLAAKQAEIAALKKQRAEEKKLDDQGAPLDLDLAKPAQEVEDKKQDVLSAAKDLAARIKDEIHKLAGISSDFLTNLNVLPKLTDSLDGLLNNQKQFGAQLNAFGETVVGKLGEAAQVFKQQGTMLEGLTERVKKVEMGLAARKANALPATV